MNYADNGAGDKDDGNDNEMGYGTVYDEVENRPQLWIILLW